MSSRSNSSTDSFVSETGDWDQPGNVVDTLGLPRRVFLSEAEKRLKLKFSFDDYREFSDVKIFKLQSTERFFSLKSDINFPSKPLFSSIFSDFDSKTDGYRVERFIQRQICVKSCHWNPTVCFLEDSHSDKFQHLMSKELHEQYNPGFGLQFDQNKKTPKLIFDNGYFPPNMNELVAELGITSSLSYDDEYALNFDHLTKEFRNYERPFFIMEEKKGLDILEALLNVTEVARENNREEMENMYRKSFDSSGSLTKPILSLMMWGPQPNNFFSSTSSFCKLENDPYNRLILEGKLHKCNFFVANDHWMFSHSEDVACLKNRFGYLNGPVTTHELTSVYPCSKGWCNVDCTCDLCENTRKRMCPLKNHKKHLTKFDRTCEVQRASQCQEHWVGHPQNFNAEEDIMVEKNLFFHNNQLVKQPRSQAVEIVHFSGIKKSCKTCRSNVQNHFEKHMVFHLQCKFCLYQIFTMVDSYFWRRVCNFCGKIFSSFSEKRMNWHKKIHQIAGEFKCFLCALQFRRKFTLERHMQDEHKEEIGEDSSEEMEDEDEGIAEDVDVTRMLNHFIDSNLKRGEKCESTSSHRKQSNKQAKEIIECEECGREFRLKRYLEMHTKYVHGSNIFFKCHECGVGYKHKGDLKRHKAAVHKLTEHKNIYVHIQVRKLIKVSLARSVLKLLQGRMF